MGRVVKIDVQEDGMGCGDFSHIQIECDLGAPMQCKTIVYVLLVWLCCTLRVRMYKREETKG